MDSSRIPDTKKSLNSFSSSVDGSPDIRKNNERASANGKSNVTTNGKENGSSEQKSASTTVPTNVSLPLDGGWGWVVVAASFYCNLVVDGIIYSFGTFLPVIMTTFGESNTKVSLIGSLLSGTYLISGPFASALANRYGFRKVTIIGAVLAGVAFFMASFAHNIEYLYITYGILGGIGFGLIFVPAVITIGFYFEKWRALATGIAVCGSGIGTFVMVPVSNYLIQSYNWQQAFIVQAGFIAVCIIGGMLFRPLPPMSVQVSLPEETENEKTISKNRSPILLKSEVVRGVKGKSGSLLNVYEDLGVTVNDITSKTEPKSYFNFNSNSKYPTASQILQLEVITDEENTTNNGTLTNLATNEEVPKNTQTSRMVLSNHELSTATYDITMKERNKSVSPELQKRYSFTPETKILLTRKYSLQPSYNSQSFMVSSSTTLASNRSGVFHRRHTDINNRPLYRDDIFFNSNLKRLPQYVSQTSSLNYTMSVTRLPTYNDIMEERKSNLTLFPEAIRRALATLFDMSLLNSLTFFILALSGFLTSIGMYTPFIYINDRAATYGIEKTEAVWLLSVVGIANTFGRVGFGVLSSIPRMNAVLINNVSLTICGTFTMFSGEILAPWYQFLYAIVFGITIACFSSLRTIIIVDLLGLEKLTNAFGLLLLFQGIAAIIGPPLAGYLVDTTGSYMLPFYISGAFIILSAVICYPIQMLNKWERNLLEECKVDT